MSDDFSEGCVFYHNQTCSKSNAVLDLLTSKRVQYKVINYLTQAPNSQTLQSILKKGELKATELVRFSEPLASELSLSIDDQRSDLEWCQILADNPQLIQRPIVVTSDRAIIGRPPERIHDLF